MQAVSVSFMFLLIAVLGGAASAAEPDQLMRNYLEAQVRAWISDDVAIEAIRAQNALTKAISQQEIDALDLAWRAEVGAAETPTITPVLENAAARLLRARIEASEGVVLEAFLMDARGLNVAVSAPTSDYWQGDEDKFTSTFPLGADAVHLSEIEFDESTQTYVGQGSMVVTDPDTGAPIGITVSFDANLLQ